jgi:hypothetical protein
LPTTSFLTSLPQKKSKSRRVTPLVSAVFFFNMLGLDYSSSDDSEDDQQSPPAVDVDIDKNTATTASAAIIYSDRTDPSALANSSPASPNLSDRAAELPIQPTSISNSTTTVSYSSAEVNPVTIQRYKQYLALPNFDLTESIRSKKDFGNPHILDVVVEHFKIDEVGRRDIF